MLSFLFGDDPVVDTTPRLPDPDEAVVSARRFIERTTGVDESDLDGFVVAAAGEIASAAIVASGGAAIPFLVGAAPYVLGVAAILVPISWIRRRLKLSGTPMPDDWYPSVLATASRDGRFFVGRLLSADGGVSVADAVKFLAIERTAEPRVAVETKLAIVESKVALIAYYEAERSILDKAISMAGSSVVGVASAAGSLVSAGIRKIRIGF